MKHNGLIVEALTQIRTHTSIKPMHYVNQSKQIQNRNNPLTNICDNTIIGSISQQQIFIFVKTKKRQN